jgi:tetratricopeptide (TPR) repeat protein
MAVGAYRERGEDPRVLTASYSALGAASAQKKEYHRAAAAFGRALEFAPDRADVRANYALTLLLSGDKPGARTNIDLAIRQNPMQAENYNVLGMVRLAEEDRDGAIQAFEKALEIKPELTDARTNLDKTRNALGKIEQGAK